MQSINVCGLTVSYENCNYASYMKTKVRLERCFEKIYQVLIHSHVSHYPVCHYIRTKENVIFSVFINSDNIMYAGIYNKKTKSIKTSCSFEDIKDIDEIDVTTLEMRILNAIQSKISYDMNVIIDAWNNYLLDKEEDLIQSDYER